MKALKHVAQAFGVILLASKRLPLLHNISGIRIGSASSVAITNTACNAFLQNIDICISYYYLKKTGSNILIDLKMQYRFLTIAVMEISETETAHKGAARELIQRAPKPTQCRNHE